MLPLLLAVWPAPARLLLLLCCRLVLLLLLADWRCYCMQPAVLLRLPLMLQLVAVAAAAAWRHSLMQLDVQRCCYCCCGLALFCMQALLLACNLRRRDAVAGTRRRPLIPVVTCCHLGQQYRRVLLCLTP